MQNTHNFKAVKRANKEREQQAYMQSTGFLEPVKHSHQTTVRASQ
jgi:hypothetical protein